jgi:hypothetical protein
MNPAKQQPCEGDGKRRPAWGVVLRRLHGAEAMHGVFAALGDCGAGAVGGVGVELKLWRLPVSRSI